MKKVLIATGNAGKIELYSQMLKEIGLEAVSPKQLGLQVQVEEDGKTEMENASKKALAYHKVSNMPVIANDSGLYIEKFGASDQPKLLVRRFGGKELTDEEMIEIYSKKLQEVGGESDGFYTVGLAVVDENGNLFAKEFKPTRHFVATASTAKIKGFPLSSLALDKKSGKYLSEMTPAEKIAYEADVMLAQKQFVHNSLQKQNENAKY